MLHATTLHLTHAPNALRINHPSPISKSSLHHTHHWRAGVCHGLDIRVLDRIELLELQFVVVLDVDESSSVAC